MRRHLRKLFTGVGLLVFVVFVSPSECAFIYCDRNDFNPPICEMFAPM